MMRKLSEMPSLVLRLIGDVETEVVEYKATKQNYDFEDIGKHLSALSNEANLDDLDPEAISFACAKYVEKIRDWVLNRSLEDYPHGMKLEERERILADVLGRYREDNPSPILVPDLEDRGGQ